MLYRDPKIRRATHNMYAYRVWEEKEKSSTSPSSSLSSLSPCPSPSRSSSSSAAGTRGRGEEERENEGFEDREIHHRPRKKGDLTKKKKPQAITRVLVADNDDDGESAAGRRMAELLHVMGVEDVLVVVSRW